MQDLSVDKAVDSVNKIKWIQMGADGIIAKIVLHNIIM